MHHKKAMQHMEKAMHHMMEEGHKKDKKDHITKHDRMMDKRNLMKARKSRRHEM